MRLLLIADACSDFEYVLSCCDTEIVKLSVKDSVYADINGFDAYCVFADYKCFDPRLREKLEKELASGKRFFVEAMSSFGDIYSAEPKSTVRSRLVVVNKSINGLTVGDLLDDGNNRFCRPHYDVGNMTPLLVYRDHIIAHRHLNLKKEEIVKDSSHGLWLVGENLLFSSFTLHNFNRARFSPRASWQSVISFIAKWLTGNEPSQMPDPVVTCGVNADLSNDESFEKYRQNAVCRGIAWLKNFLVDNGEGGILEGLRHNINSDGAQQIARSVRADCSGEAAGAFRFFGMKNDDADCLTVAKNLEQFVLGPMLVKGGLFDGMLRWSDAGWPVCYQDDVARAILPMLYSCAFFGGNDYLPDICRILDFLVKTTPMDGCRDFRTDAPGLDEDKINEIQNKEHGTPSAHYNAYYHAALILAYKCTKNETYLAVGKKGIETLMNLYPDTRREQSETEEMCRLVLPLAVLYDVTGEIRHKDMLYRVVGDLVKHKHPSGGYYEWDTGYTAVCSRESQGECSLLTENGDPVADLLYSTNWLPIAFAVAYKVTGDKMFYDLWRDVAAFCINAQISSADPKTDGSWCRAFDLELKEVYGCPHDVGWAANCSETGWTNAEILMGLMLPELFEK